MTMILKRRRALQTLAAAGAALAAPTVVRAQDTLDSLKILVGFPAGGSADVVYSAPSTSPTGSPVSSNSVAVIS